MFLLFLNSLSLTYLLLSGRKGRKGSMGRKRGTNQRQLESQETVKTHKKGTKFSPESKPSLGEAGAGNFILKME